MTPRKGFTDLQRLKIFEAAKGVCHICELKIQAGEKWDVEHKRPRSMGGTDDPANLGPAHVACHKDKSRAEAPVLAKVLRQRAKHIGAHKPRGFPKPPPGYKYSFGRRNVREAT